MEAFKNYDFDGDEGWQNYLLNLTIPADKSHLLIKYKAKYYQKNVDPDFDAVLVAAAQKKPSVAQEPSSPESNQTTQPRQRSTAATKSSSAQEPEPQSAPPQPATTHHEQQPSSATDLAIFIGNVALVVCVFVSLAPLISRRLAFSAYFAACRISTIVHISRIFQKFGRPSFSSFRAYTQQAGTTTDFFYFICSLMAASNPHMWLITLPMAILAAYHASAYAHKHYRHITIWKQYGQQAHTWLATHKTDSLQLMAGLEILTLVHAFVGIFKIGFKGMIAAYMYSTRLRVRLWSPDTRQYHINAWKILGEKVAPLLRAVPMLQNVVARGEVWFNKQPRQHQA